MSDSHKVTEWLEKLNAKCDEELLDEKQPITINDEEATLLLPLYEEYNETGRVNSKSICKSIKNGMVNKHFFNWYFKLELSDITRLDIIKKLVKSMNTQDFIDTVLFPLSDGFIDTYIVIIQTTIMAECLHHKNTSIFERIIIDAYDNISQMVIDAALTFFEREYKINEEDYDTILEMLSYNNNPDDCICNNISMDVIFNISWYYGHKGFAKHILSKYPDLMIDISIRKYCKKCHRMAFHCTINCISIIGNSDLEYLRLIKNRIEHFRRFSIMDSVTFSNLPDTFVKAVLKELCQTEADVKQSNVDLRNTAHSLSVIRTIAKRTSITSTDVNLSNPQYSFEIVYSSTVQKHVFILDKLSEVLTKKKMSKLAFLSIKYCIARKQGNKISVEDLRIYYTKALSLITKLSPKLTKGEPLREYFLKNIKYDVDKWNAII